MGLTNIRLESMDTALSKTGVMLIQQFRETLPSCGQRWISASVLVLVVHLYLLVLFSWMMRFTLSC